MPDAIRLVCPECDAVHRVKEITLGKLYRCKKCKSGLITMTPAVLVCPSCGATTPPSHIEVSRLITCQECEDAPLMSVRFASSGRSSDTRLHRDTTRDLAKDLAKETAKESALLLEEPSVEESLAAEVTRQAAAPEVQDTPKISAAPATPSTQPAPSAAAAPASAPAPAMPAETRSEPARPQPEDAPQPDAPAANRPVRIPEPDNAETPPVDAPRAAPTTAAAATPAQSQTDAQAADSRASSRRFTRDRKTTEVREVPAAPPTRRINDTAFITRRSEELLEHAEKTLESLQDEPLSATISAPEPSMRSPARDEPATLADDSFLAEPSRRPPSAVAAEEMYDQYAPGESDLPQLRKILLELQQPYLKELSRSRLSVPAWIPIAFALLLFGLFGWLVGEIDFLKAELSSANRQRQQLAENLPEQKAEENAEKNRLTADNQRLQLMLQQEQNSKLAQMQILLQTQSEKKRLESDLAEIMSKYEVLQKNSFSGLPGLPELDPKDR